MTDTVINTNLAELSTGITTDTQTSTQTSTNPNSMTLQEHMQHISDAISTTSDNVNKANIDSIFASYYVPTDNGVFTPIVNKISNGKTTKEIPKILFASNNTMQLSSAEIDANVTGSNNEQYTMKLNFETTPSTFVENLQGTTEIESGLNNNPPATTTRGFNDLNIGTNCNNLIAEKDQAIRDKTQAIAEKDQAIAEKDQAIAEKNQAIAEKDQAIAEKNQCISDKNQEAINYQNTIANKDATITELNTTIQNQKNTISTHETTISEKEAKILQLQDELTKLRN